MKMNHIRFGNGKPLLLIHGIGGSWRSWSPVLSGLSEHREVIAVDLPGFGKTAPLKGEVSIATLADAVTAFLRDNHLTGTDAVGSSMGARLVLELVRRGSVLSSVVSLNPGGFWQGYQTHLFYGSIALSIRLIRLFKSLGLIETLTKNNVSRSILFAQFSARPWKIHPKVAFDELSSYANSPSFDELLYNLAYGERQQGCAAGTIRNPLVIGWGKQDKVCFPGQAKKALELFPDAYLHWFDKCGHFPQWDKPKETIDLILKTTDNNQYQNQHNNNQQVEI
jgi:pimeloyl-ACP methyl ester carboxylesterase